MSFLMILKVCCTSCRNCWGLCASAWTWVCVRVCVNVCARPPAAWGRGCGYLFIYWGLSLLVFPSQALLVLWDREKERPRAEMSLPTPIPGRLLLLWLIQAAWPHALPAAACPLLGHCCCGSPPAPPAGAPCAALGQPALLGLLHHISASPKTTYTTGPLLGSAAGRD